MTVPWFLFYGRKHFGMQKQEIMCTRYGEMMDMIDCEAVENGTAKVKRKEHSIGYDDIFALN